MGRPSVDPELMIRMLIGPQEKRIFPAYGTRHGTNVGKIL